MMRNMGVEVNNDMEEPSDADVMAILNENGFGPKK
jgi:hypothetical protein